MTLSDAQIEWIVCEVVRRLTTALRDGERVPTSSSEPRKRPTLALDDRVVATSTLRGRLAGIERLELGVQAIVTPAVRDLLRDQGVELVRRA